MPASVLGAPPIRSTDTQTAVDCLLTDETAGSAYVSAGVSEEFGEFGIVGFWEPGTSPYEDEPALVSGAATVMLAADGSTITATFVMHEWDPTAENPLGAIVGPAVLDASLTEAGPVEEFSDAFRDGNRRVRISGTFQPLAVEGTLTLPGGISYTDLSGCLAGRSVVATFETNPNAYIYTSDQLVVSCYWEDADSFVGLTGITDEFGSFADVFVVDASGAYFGFAESALLTSTEFSAGMDLISEMTNEVSGSAVVDASLTPGDRLNSMERFGNEKFKVVGQELLVTGTLSLETPAGARVLPMDEGACFAQDAKSRSIITNPNPGKGPRLANDTPVGAVPLVPGDSVTVRTGGTVLDPEAPCTVSDPEFGDFEVPLGHTAWYTVDGTGGAITVDSAGSDFDTVIGVYTSDGGSFTQVACVDDVFEEPDFFSLQARVTIETDPGATYYVQVGGWGGASGRLSLAVY
ncbi:MAG TPA: hypothetical protein VF071_02075 [Candidatus Limnocylindria bacterium]